MMVCCGFHSYVSCRRPMWMLYIPVMDFCQREVTLQKPLLGQVYDILVLHPSVSTKWETKSWQERKLLLQVWPTVYFSCMQNSYPYLCCFHIMFKYRECVNLHRWVTAYWHFRCASSAWYFTSSRVIRWGKEVLWVIWASCDIQSSLRRRWSRNEASYAYVGELLWVISYYLLGENNSCYFHQSVGIVDWVTERASGL